MVSFVYDNLNVSHLRMRNNNTSNLHFKLCLIMAKFSVNMNIVKLKFMNVAEFVLHMDS